MNERALTERMKKLAVHKEWVWSLVSKHLASAATHTAREYCYIIKIGHSPSFMTVLGSDPNDWVMTRPRQSLPLPSCPCNWPFLSLIIVLRRGPQPDHASRYILCQFILLNPLGRTLGHFISFSCDLFKMQVQVQSVSW